MLIGKGHDSFTKKEILFSASGISHNNEPEIFRKGSIIYCNICISGDGMFRLPLRSHRITMHRIPLPKIYLIKTRLTPWYLRVERRRKASEELRLISREIEHVDLISDTFWEKKPWLFTGKPS